MLNPVSIFCFDIEKKVDWKLMSFYLEQHALFMLVSNMSVRLSRTRRLVFSLMQHG